MDIEASPRNRDCNCLPRASCSVRSFSARATILIPSLGFLIAEARFRFDFFKRNSPSWKVNVLVDLGLRQPAEATTSGVTGHGARSAGREISPGFGRRNPHSSAQWEGHARNARSVSMIDAAKGPAVYSKPSTASPRLFSGHSLRASFLTSAAGKGASIFKMMDVSLHKSVDTLRGYVRDAELFKDHAGAGLL